MTRFYEEEELKKIQAMELGILKDFIKICEENNFHYFAIAGTGIGAIRHKGFIPWDDDIDVVLPRREYEKFIQIAQRDYSDRYYVLNAETDKNYPLTTTRWCIKGTRFVEELFRDVDCPFGIFLDIYAYDNLPDNKVLYNLQVWEAWLLSKLIILCSIEKPYLGFYGDKAKYVQKACSAGYYVMKKLHISKDWLYRRCKKVCTRYNHKKTARFGYPCDADPNWNTLYKNKTFPVSHWEFEGMQVAFPKDIRAMLRGFYKDTYMELPPVEKRKTHYPYILDFGDGKNVRTTD